MDYSEFTDREGLQRLLERTEPQEEPTGNKVMHVTKLEGAMEGFLTGVIRRHAHACARGRRQFSRPFQLQNIHTAIP